MTMRLYHLDSMPNELTLGQVAHIFAADHASVLRVLNMGNIKATVDLKPTFQSGWGYEKEVIAELAKNLDAEHGGYTDRRTIEQKARAIFDRKGLVEQVEFKAILATGSIKGRTIEHDKNAIPKLDETPIK